jgi:hypothetical protein
VSPRLPACSKWLSAGIGNGKALDAHKSPAPKPLR